MVEKLFNSLQITLLQVFGVCKTKRSRTFAKLCMLHLGAWHYILGLIDQFKAHYIPFKLIVLF